MARRTSLNGVAQGILGSFISRNNDVDGYWGIGMLCLHAERTSSERIVVDLLGRTISPPSNELGTIVVFYNSILASQAHGVGIDVSLARHVEITVEFSDQQENSELPYYAHAKLFVCTVRITDDLGHIHEAVANGWCRPHDPNTESRSSRAERASNQPLNAQPSVKHAAH